MIKSDKAKRFGLGLVSLVFALLLFMVAKTVAYNSTTHQINRLTETYTHTLQAVPVELIYDEETYFISNYNYDMEVYLSSTNRIKLDSEINPDTRSFKLVADLSQMGDGEIEVPVQVEDLPNDVTADVRPEQIRLTIGRKASRQVQVDLDVADHQIGAGYVLSEASVDLETAEVISDESLIDQVTRVVARLPEETVLTKSFQDQVQLLALDAQGQVLPAVLSPDKASLSLKVKKLTKTVPLVVELVGEIDPSLTGLTYELGLSEAIISGSQENLDATDQVVVKVDVTGIKKDTRRTITLSADNVSVTPEVVDVRLSVTKKTTN